MDKITLYPSNWLYNAGVVGFLRVLEFAEKDKLKKTLSNEPVSITEEEIDIINDAYWSFGLIYLLSENEIIEKCLSEMWKKFKKKRDAKLPSIIENTLEEKLKQPEKDFKCLKEFLKIKNLNEFKKFDFNALKDELKNFYFEIIDIVVNTKGKKSSKDELIEFKKYVDKNFTENELQDLLNLLKTFLKNKLGSKNSVLAGHPIFNPGVEIYRSEKKFRELIEKVKNSIRNAENLNSSPHCKICGISLLTNNYDLSWNFFARSYSSLMGTSYEEVPNFFFYFQHDILICDLCQLIFILSPYGLPPDQKEFINVPSIKTLFYLNNLLLKFKKTETYKTLTPNQRLESLISEAILNYEFLKGAWILQNVEFIQIEKGDQPKVYTLPVSRTSAELIIRSDVRKSLANLKGQITIVKKEKNPYAQREGIKRFLTGGEGSLVDLTYFAFKNDFMENNNSQAKEVALNLAKLEKIRINYKKERRFKMIENDLIEIWNIGQELKKVKFDKNLEYELLSASLIEEKKRLLEYLSEIDKRNKLDGKLNPLCEFIKSKENLNVREIILAFIAGYKSDKSLSYEDMLENPLKVFWKEGKEIGDKVEKDIVSRIKKYVFRTISKIRVGDRNGAIFEILKFYLLSENPVPTYLSVMFRDTLDIEKFKLYAYSFLSGFIGKDEREARDLMFEMEKIGNNLKEESLVERIKKYGYRLLSFIRAGQRAEFAYEIIKLYAQLGKEIPYKFIEILDPDKPIAEFQSLAYGVLSGYLKI
ncbi:MAG: type I-B CRISPR-associated protein Cas8b1/Cst1 [candidate division WOR-3 bacterium]